MVLLLTFQRPHCDSMGNAIKALKDKVRELDTEQSEQDQKDDLREWIQSFIRTRITLAQSAIADTTSSREQIADGDVVLTYSTSVLMVAIVSKAHSLGKKFRVIVVRGVPCRPLHAGSLHAGSLHGRVLHGRALHARSFYAGLFYIF